MYYLAWNAKKEIERSGTDDYDDACVMAKIMSRSTAADQSAIIAVIEEGNNKVHCLYYNGICFEAEVQ